MKTFRALAAVAALAIPAFASNAMALSVYANGQQYVIDSIQDLNNAAGATLSSAPDGIRVLDITNLNGFIRVGGIEAGDVIVSAQPGINAFPRSVHTTQELWSVVQQAASTGNNDLLLKVRDHNSGQIVQLGFFVQP